MSTLHELRETLHSSAARADLADDLGAARVAAVRGRARRVRRRRAAGVVTAAVLAVGSAAVIPTLTTDGPDRPDGPVLAGHEVPTSIASVGWTYEFSRGVQGQRRVAVRLPVSDGPRLLAWAGEGEEFRLRTPFGTQRVSARNGFDDFVVVGAGEDGRWRLSAPQGRVALAVYELTDDRPSGTTLAGETFRDRVGEDRLVDTALGAVGDSDVALDVPAPTDGLRVALLCQGIPEGMWVNVAVDGTDPAHGAGCGPDFDPGVGGPVWEADELPPPGRPARARVWVSRRPGGDPVPLADVRLAIGAYAVAEPAEVVAGHGFPEVYEYDGQRWRLDRVSSEAGRVDAAVQNTGTGQVLAVGWFTGADGAVRVQPGSGRGYSTTSPLAGPPEVVLLPGERASLHGDADPTQRSGAGFAVYRPVD